MSKPRASFYGVGTVPKSAIVPGDVAVALAELGGVGASYDFQNIPQAYRHLMLVVYARSDTAAASTALRMRLQNVSTATYYDQRIIGSGTSITADEALAQTSARVGLIPAASSSATLLGTTTILLPHYTQGNGEKPYLSSSIAVLAFTSGNVILSQFGGQIDLTSLIDRITLFPAAGSFVADSLATLYGLPE